MPAARPGWRFDSWDMLTSSICHTQACTLGGEGFCSTHQTSNHWATASVRWGGDGVMCLLPWFGWQCPVFLCRQGFPSLWLQICSPSEGRTPVSGWNHKVNLRFEIRVTYHVVNRKHGVISLLVEWGHLQGQLKIFMVVFQMSLDLQPPETTRDQFV